MSRSTMTASAAMKKTRKASILNIVASACDTDAAALSLKIPISCHEAVKVVVNMKSMGIKVTHANGTNLSCLSMISVPVFDLLHFSPWYGH